MTPVKINLVRKEGLVLKTERLILRTVVPEDANEIYLSWLNDSDVIAMLETIKLPYLHQSLHAYVEASVANQYEYLFIANIKDSGKQIGTIRLHGIHAEHGTAHLGFMVGDKSEWGKGFGGEMHRTVIDFAFSTVGVRKICEVVRSDNKASIAMHLRAGFEIEGVQKKQIVTPGGYVDKVILGLFNK